MLVVSRKYIFLNVRMRCEKIKEENCGIARNFKIKVVFSASSVFAHKNPYD